jgi:hypothetical protein
VPSSAAPPDVGATLRVIIEGGNRAGKDGTGRLKGTLIDSITVRVAITLFSR